MRDWLQQTVESFQTIYLAQIMKNPLHHLTWRKLHVLHKVLQCLLEKQKYV